MRSAKRSGVLIGCCCVWVALWSVSCINESRRFYRIDLDVEVVSTDGVSAPGVVVVHHAWFGEGVVRHPLGPIATFEVGADGRLSAQVDYPLEDGEGVVVYAWQDRDGDGVLCAPGSAPEPAGLVELGEVAHVMSARVELTTSCVGAERLYPAAEPR